LNKIAQFSIFGTAPAVTKIVFELECQILSCSSRNWCTSELISWIIWIWWEMFQYPHLYE